MTYSPLRENSYVNRVVKTCTSTNDLAKKLAQKGYPHGTWVSALEQTQGRGRFEKKWESPEGQLYLSCILKDIPPLLLTWTPLITAISILDALKKEYPLFKNSFENLKIKWPNDILFKQKKLAGILCEGNSSSPSTVIVGMGINRIQNLNNPSSTSLEAIFTSPLSLDRLREKILRALLDQVKQLTSGQQTPSDLKEAYEQQALLRKGSCLTSENQNPITILGLGDQGELLVLEANGVKRSLYASQDSLSFLYHPQPNGQGS